MRPSPQITYTRLRAASKKMSSVSPPIGNFATTFPESMSYTSINAGVRAPTKRRRPCSSSAIGKFDTVRAAVRYEQPVGLRQVNQALRLAEAGDALLVPVARDVQNFHRVISQGGDEQAMALKVGGKVVDASLHAGHLDRRYELQ